MIFNASCYRKKKYDRNKWTTPYQKKKPDCHLVRFISVEITSRILYGIRVFTVDENLKVSKECVVYVVYYLVNEVFLTFLFFTSVISPYYVHRSVNCSFICAALYLSINYIYMYFCVYVPICCIYLLSQICYPPQCAFYTFMHFIVVRLYYNVCIMFCFRWVVVLYQL